jgi:hypothetical protein
LFYFLIVAEIAEVKQTANSPHKRGKQPKPVDPRKLVEALTPIRETTFEEYDDSQRDKMESQSEQVIKMMAAAHKEPKPKEEVWYNSLSIKYSHVFYYTLINLQISYFHTKNLL